MIRLLKLALAATLWLSAATNATNWSTQTHDVYPGDFDGNGKDDLLVIAKSRNDFSGIFSSSSGQPSAELQTWDAGFLGIEWHSGAYTAVVGDFDGNGRDDVLLQSVASGRSYVIKTDSSGRLFGVIQTLEGWSQTNYRIISGNFDGAGGDDVFLQAAQPSGVNHVVLSNSAGQLTTTSHEFANNHLGFKWSTKNAVIHTGDFNGDGRNDLLIQAKPEIILIDYEIPIPVPVFKPQSFGITLATAAGQFTSIHQLWSRKDFGVDWSPNVADLVIGDFNGDNRDDVMLVARDAAKSSYVVLATSSGQMSTSAAQTLSSGTLGTTWSAVDYRMVAADFNGDGRSELYRQSTSAGGTNGIVSFGSSGTASSVGSHSAPAIGAGSGSTGLPLTVGRVPGEFAVDASGAATYSIPIEVPVGAGGLKPALGLTYSSSSGSGLLGVGWDLAGLSEITRCERTFAQDGVSQGVTLTTNDRFCLDGNRLRGTSGTYGAHGATYQTEIETFSRVTSYTSGGAGSAPTNGPQYFRVEGKDGLYYLYGQTEDSRVEVRGTNIPRTWALNRVEDRNGNYLTITYTDGSDGSGFNGSYRPSSITWTKTQSGAGPYFRVLFTYQGRPVSDTDTGYFAGGSITENQLLDYIDVEALEGSWTRVRRYNATYESAVSSTGRSRLASISECSATGCLPATNFSYQNGLSAWTSLTTFGATVDSMKYVHAIDFDGDGISDLIYPKNNSWHYRRGSRTGTFQAETNTSLSTGTGATASYLTAKPFTLGEAGRTGLIMRSSGTTGVILGWNGTSLTTRATNVPNDIFATSNYWVGDFDGNGRDDVLYISGTGLNYQFQLLKNNGSGAPFIFNFDPVVAVGTASGAVYYLNSPYIESSLHDFNGDGKTDIFYWTADGGCPPGEEINCPVWSDGYALLSTGTTFSSRRVWRCDGNAGRNSPIEARCDSHSPSVADFNGDGISDVRYSSWNVTYTAFGTGTGFDVKPMGGPLSGTPVDYDNDGRTDLLTSTCISGTCSYSINRFNGAGFDGAVSVAITHPSADPPVIRVMDSNGDGLQDIGYFNATGYYTRFHAGPTPDLLLRATDGFGNFSAPTYALLTDTAVYSKGAAASFPSMDVQVPMHVVKSFSTSSGIASPSEYEVAFKYSGLRVHLQGRGLLGFSQRQVTDQRAQHQIKTEENYSQDFPYVGMVVSATAYQPGSQTVISKSTITPANTPLDVTQYNERYFPYASKVVEDKREISSGYSGTLITSSETTAVYDSWGNLTSKTTKVTDKQSGSELYNQSSESSVVNTTDVSDSALLPTLITNWCIGTVRKTEVSAKPYGQSSFDTRTTQYQHDFPNCRLSEQIVEPGNRDSAKVTTTLTYYTSGASKGQAYRKEVIGVSPTGYAAPVPRAETYEYQAGTALVSKVTNAIGSVSSVWKIGLGLETRRVDLNNKAVDYVYDGFGRLLTESRPDATQTTYQIYPCSSGCGYATGRYQIVASSTGGAQRAVIADQFDRELQSTTWLLGGAQSHTKTEYDVMGRVWRTTAPMWSGGAEYWFTNTYDYLGRPLSQQSRVSETDGSTQTVAYTYKGLQIDAQDAEGKTTTRWSNAIGQVVRMIDPAGSTTRYSYDHFGSLINSQDPAGNVVGGTFDIRGRKKTSNDPDMGAWTYVYNSLGELLEQRDAKNQATSLTYDPVGRLLRRTEAEGTSTFEYDTAQNGKGMLYRMSAPSGHTETYAYDTLSRPKDVSTTVDGITHVVTASYNTNGQLDTLTYPQSYPAGYRFKLQYRYEHGMLRQIEDASAPSTVYWSALDTNAAGAISAERFGNGISTSSWYDAANGQLRERFAGPNYSGAVQSLRYSWDRVGNLKSREDLRQSPALKEDFFYDNLYRLDYSNLDGNQNLDMTYDLIGNITQKSDVGGYVYTGGQTGCAYPQPHAQPHAVRRAGSAIYCYDANGNMSKRNGDLIDWYSFNLPKKIRKGTNSSEWSYAADRSKFKQISINGTTTETTIYIGSLFERVTRMGGAIEYRHYIPGADGPSAIHIRRSNNTNETNYLHRDHQGSVVAVTNSSGAVISRLSYDAFGKRRNEQGWGGVVPPTEWSQINAISHRGYTDHEMLDSVDMIHMNGRVFDPALARFASADPFVQAPFNLQSLNRYSYVFNNPLSYTDPSGFFGWKDVKRGLKSLHKFHRAPTLKNMFDALRNVPGQRAVDRYVMTHRWAYQVGYAAAVVSSYWIGGYGGALYAAYYTYVATGSMTEAVTTGVLVAAQQYMSNYMATGNGATMSAGSETYGAPNINGVLVLSAGPDGGSGGGRPNLFSLFFRMVASAPDLAEQREATYQKALWYMRTHEGFNHTVEYKDDYFRLVKREAKSCGSTRAEGCNLGGFTDWNPTRITITRLGVVVDRGQAPIEYMDPAISVADRSQRRASYEMSVEKLTETEWAVHVLAHEKWHADNGPTPENANWEMYADFAGVSALQRFRAWLSNQQ